MDIESQEIKWCINEAHSESKTVWKGRRAELTEGPEDGPASRAGQPQSHWGGKNEQGINPTDGWKGKINGVKQDIERWCLWPRESTEWRGRGWGGGGGAIRPGSGDKEKKQGTFWKGKEQLQAG